MSSAPKLGSDSFWEMTALTMAGGLASCRSCVEHFYFQSYQNANLFLDSCVAGRLLERVSLLDLYGDLGARPKPTLRQRWYDEPIYMSAPSFRSLHLDAARQRLENTKRAVLDALRLYHEELRGDDNAIDAAYAAAIEASTLRHSEIARERATVDMSPVAKLRLIQDGFRSVVRRGRPRDSREEIEGVVSKKTADYVSQFFGSVIPQSEKSDYARELDAFIEEYLDDTRNTNEFWRDSFGELPKEHKLLWLPVVKELVRKRHVTLLQNSGADGAAQFTDKIKSKAKEAQKNTNDHQYKAALREFESDVEGLLLDTQREAA